MATKSKGNAELYPLTRTKFGTFPMNSLRRTRLIITPGNLEEKFRYKRPPLPSPLLQRRRGNSNNSPVTKLRCHCTSGFFPRPLSGLRLSYLSLLFFSVALAAAAPPPDTFSVLDFGAKGDAKT